MAFHARVAAGKLMALKLMPLKNLQRPGTQQRGNAEQCSKPKPQDVTVRAVLFGATALLALAGAGSKAQAADLFYTIGALPGPGSFDPVTFSEVDFNQTISYNYEIDGGGTRGDTANSGTPNQTVNSWLFGFHLGPGFTGSTAYLDLTLRNQLGNSLTAEDFGITSNATPPGHPPPGTIGGGGRDAGLGNVATLLVPGHSDELRLLADLDTPTSKIDNEYDLLIQGLGFGGRSSFTIRGPVSVAAVPVPAALPLFAAALLVLGFCQHRAKRRRQRQNPAPEPQRPDSAAAA